ncbi:MAG: exonuclease SbcCD subunit D [Proteobacteria bacterium]|nr:exonuclease SbcCD subunit D [Pseudomonadota bacterium]
MKILHSADWHLGRYLHGASLLEDQRLILEQFVDLARSEQVDVVVIAGDIYDRAIPPSEAVALLDSVLTRLVVDAGIPTIVIAGNHDSAERIGFGGRIFAQRGLTLRGTLNNLSPVVLSDAHGEVAFHPLPYVEPLFARHLPGGEDVTDHQSAMTHLMSLLKAQRVPGQRNVLVGHAFVTGGSESDSERPLSVGGSGRVGADSFDGFDFVALGHLHRPQSIGSDRIQYSGSRVAGRTRRRRCAGDQTRGPQAQARPAHHHRHAGRVARPARRRPEPRRLPQCSAHRHQPGVRPDAAAA